MRVSDVMTPRPVTVGLNDSLRTAIKLMTATECRRLPVINRHGQLVGIISDRDTRLALQSPYLFHEQWEDEALLNTITVRQCMTATPITIEPQADIQDAINLMLQYRISGLPVVLSETLVGIVTTTDIMAAFVRKLQQNGEVGAAQR
ncbi:MAG: CBS domain-containing protein [Anaerolineae bacterium]|nr:CBS domain-containing protein [Anaerolineae bacterium]